MGLDPAEERARDLAERLPEIARAAVGEPGAALGDWAIEPLRGGFGTIARASQPFQVTGTTIAGGAERHWGVVLKVIAPATGPEDPSHITYPRRERLLYASGILDALPPGLRAPRCYGWDDRPNGSAWIWLEHIREDRERIWPLERWALAARQLGQFNGAFAIGRPLPRAPWLGGRRLRSWLERYPPLIARIAAAPGDSRISLWWPRPIVDAILQVWTQRDVFCDALERLPQTFGHGDAIRRNLLSRRAADGSEETVGIDWENAGHYALGEDAGQTLSVASAFYDLEPSELPTLDEALFGSYLEGLRDAGWRGDPRQVRFAYSAHAALRNLFNAVGTLIPDDTQRAATSQNQGRTWEELAERRAAIRPFLLERAAEARQMLESGI